MIVIILMIVLNMYNNWNTSKNLQHIILLVSIQLTNANHMKKLYSAYLYKLVVQLLSNNLVIESGFSEGLERPGKKTQIPHKHGGWT